MRIDFKMRKVNSTFVSEGLMCPYSSFLYDYLKTMPRKAKKKKKNPAISVVSSGGDLIVSCFTINYVSLLIKNNLITIN